MSKRDTYVQQLHAKIDEWNADIDKLTAKASQVEAESRKEYQQQIDALKRKRKEIEGKLNDLKRSGEEAGSDFKTGIDLALDAMNEAIRSAMSRFKKS